MTLHYSAKLLGGKRVVVLFPAGLCHGHRLPLRLTQQRILAQAIQEIQV